VHLLLPRLQGRTPVPADHLNFNYSDDFPNRTTGRTSYSVGDLGECISIDEGLVKWRGKLGFRFYNLIETNLQSTEPDFTLWLIQNRNIAGTQTRSQVLRFGSKIRF